MSDHSAISHVAVDGQMSQEALYHAGLSAHVSSQVNDHIVDFTALREDISSQLLMPGWAADLWATILSSGLVQVGEGERWPETPG